VDRANDKRVEFIRDFEEAVLAIENSSAELIGIATIYFDEVSFIVFYEVTENKILGILKSRKVDIAPRPDGYPELKYDFEKDPYFQKYAKGVSVK